MELIEDLDIQTRQPVKKSLIRSISKQIWKEFHHRQLLCQRNPIEAQEKVFRKLQVRFDGTVFAKDLKLSQMKGIKDYLQYVPARDFEGYRPYVDRIAAGEQGVLFRDACTIFVQTSGTTGYLNKYIPYNVEMMRAAKRFQYKTAATIATYSVDADPALDVRFSYATVVRNTSRMIGKIPKSNASELWSVVKKPLLGANKQVLTAEVLDAPTWEEKLGKIAQASVHRDVCIATGIPLYLVGVFEYILKNQRINSLKEIWPRFQTLFYSGSALGSFRQRLDTLAGQPLSYFTGYLASEGVFGLPNGTCGNMLFNIEDFLFSFRDTAGALNSADSAHPELISLEHVKQGHEYEVFVGCPNGLLQFRVGDIVRIDTVQPYVSFTVLGRDLSINVANEKTSQVRLDQAISKVKTDFNLRLKHYFVYPENGLMINEQQDLPYYQWNILLESGEIIESPMFCEKIASALDHALLDAAPDYRDCRVTDGLIGKPRVRILPARLAHELLELNQGMGQYKMKSVYRNREEYHSAIRPAAERMGLSDF